MKKTYIKKICSIICLLALLFLVSCNSSGKETKAPGSDKNGEEKEVIQISTISLKPDFLIDVKRSDTILRGEVLEVLGEEHANPDGTLISKRGDPIPLALVTRYRFRVDEVYRSLEDISVGDVITVATVHSVFVTEDSLDKIEVESETPTYYLHEGQNGIFFFVTDLNMVPEGADNLLFLRHSGVVFDSVDENGIYHSTLFDLDPADLPEMYVEAEEKWGMLGK